MFNESCRFLSYVFSPSREGWRGFSSPGEVEGACRDGERLNYTQRIGFVTTSVS